MLFISLLLAGCQTTPQQVAKETFFHPVLPGERVKVGVLLPLSGPHSQVGLDLQRATSLSLLEAGGDNVALLYRDTQGEPEQAVSAAKDLMKEKVHLIVGPLFSATTVSVHGLLRREGIPILSFSSDFSIAGGGVYLMGFDPAEQLRRIILYAHKNSKRHFVILVPEGPLQSRTEVALTGLNGRGVAENAQVLTYKKGDLASIKSLSDKLKKITCDALVIPDGQDASTILSTLLYYEVPLDHIQLLGSAQWNGKMLSRDPNFYKAWYPAPEERDRRAFESRFQTLMGHAPHRLASLAYDAVAIAVTLANRHPTNPYNMRTLTHETGFLGLDGLFRFLASGTNERGLSIYEIAPSGVRVREVAPKKFGR